MRTEYGRSLIELVGVLAITGVMTASAIALYNSIRHNQQNTIAAATLREVAQKSNLLMGMRGDYTGISVEYLIKSGVLKTDAAPIGRTWSVDPGSIDLATFEIKLHGLTHGECDFFAAALPAWAEAMIVNGIPSTEYVQCISAPENDITFIAR
ncbi:MAG: hypothetical protein J5613_01645 [Alphaproteobacteria bacterium]|nr:hypothetical protein [Alphaproteobacteria bacterium]MBR4806247.1 hypothetical protein [Alphaproteobacteria bacterium]